jgi:glycosyltransferase involved in cell wall biosynthesis
MSKMVSIIVTTRNEQAVIERLLLSLKSQTYKPIEILVVDNKSQDATKKNAKKYTKKVFNAGPERSAQRNFGAGKAKGQFFLFLDADMELSEKVVEQSVKAILKSEKIGMVVIPEVSVAHRFWEKIKAYERSFYNADGDTAIDAARFFKKELFRKVGGYDESITGPEDWDLPEQIRALGFTSVRIKAPIYHHERIRSVWELGRKKYYYGLRAHTYMAKNKVAVVGAKTIYILRPVFYKQWKKLLANPILSGAMFFMLLVEQFCGGWGYLYGRLKRI